MNSRGRTTRGTLSAGAGASRGTRGGAGSSRGSTQRGRGGPPARGGYQRLERPPYDDYGYDDGYQGGYGHGPQGGLMPPASLLNYGPYDMELEMMGRERQLMMEEQRARLQTRQYEYHHSYAAGAEQRGFKRPAYPPALLGPPQPKRFPGCPGPAFRPPIPPFPPALLPDPAGPFRPPRPTNRTLLIFRGPHAMSNVVKSRIDACVGLVVREMKLTVFGPPKNIDMGQWEMRKLKEKIRERIHAMLMNKPVGSNEELLAKYRTLHAKRDDEAFVMSVKESMDKELGVVYMTENLRSALTNKLEEMFDMLSQIYDDESEPTTSNRTEDVDMSTAGKSSESNKTVNTESDDTTKQNEMSDSKITKDVKEGSKDAKGKHLQEAADEGYLKDKLDSLLKDSLPKILPKFKNSLIAIICKDGNFTYHEDVTADSEHKTENGDKSKENGDRVSSESNQDNSSASVDVESGMSEETAHNEKGDYKNTANNTTEKENSKETVNNDADELEELLTMIKDTTEGEKAEENSQDQKKTSTDNAPETSANAQTRRTTRAAQKN